ncbi:hydroxysqualene dehydroxylase HpnE [Magnetococcales bacterium HHB-1]
MDHTPLIIGSGVAGLTAALDLAEKGYRPTLLESAPHPGGRAGSFWDKILEETLDTGPHILIKACPKLQKRLKQLNTDHLLKSAGLRYCFLDENYRIQPFHCPDWPAPFHLLAGILRFKPLSKSDLASVFRLARDLHTPVDPALEELSVTHWLQSLKQRENICRNLWFPLCLAALNEPAASANAALFKTILKRAFLEQPDGAEPLLPQVPLSQLIIEPAIEQLRQKGCSIHFRTRILKMTHEADRITALHTSSGAINTHNRLIISAIPPFALARITPFWTETKKLLTWPHSPIVSLHFTFPQSPPTAWPDDLIGLPFHFSQWLIRRHNIPKDRFGISAVLSGAYREVEQTPENLIQKVQQDILKIAPALKSTPNVRVLKAKKATFSAWPGIRRFRWKTQTPWKNLLLAGDWTDTDLPATLEGAVISGERAAQTLIHALLLKR